MNFQRSVIIFLLVIFGIFLILLYFFPAVTFLIILACATVHIIGNLLDRLVKSKYRTLFAALFSFSLYLVMAGFILSLSGLIQKISGMSLDNLPFREYIEKYMGQIRTYFDPVSLTSSLAEIGIYSIIYPVLTFFLLKEKNRLKKGAIWLVPNRYFETILNLFYHVNKKLRAYFKGLIIQITAYSTVCTLGFIWLIPKYALVLGIIAGIANIIPFFGTIFDYVVLSLILYFFVGKTGVITVIITISIAQFVDMIVYPIAYSKVLSIPSSLIIISVLLWGKFFGIMGMLLAVPFTALIHTIFVEFGHTLKYYYWEPKRYPLGAGTTVAETGPRPEFSDK